MKAQQTRRRKQHLAAKVNRGVTPYAEEIRKMQEQMAETVQKLAEEKTVSIMRGVDLQNVDGRLLALQRIAENVDSGDLERASAEALVKTVKQAQNEALAKGDDRANGLNVHFIEIKSNDDAERLLAGEYGPTSVNELIQ